MIKAIIIEDEFHPRETLIQKLKNYHPEIEVLAACENAENGLIEILRRKPDLIFLDIQLPENDGLWLAGELHKMTCDSFTPPGIIFTTAYTDSQYLLNAFKLAAIDYLVKPVLLDDLAVAIERFKKMERASSGAGSLMMALEKGKLLKFKNYGGLLLLKTEDIAYIEADGKYAQILLADGKTEYIFDSLVEIESFIPFDTFIRTGRSFIINKDYIRRIDIKKSVVQVATPVTSYSLKISERAIRQLKEDMEKIGR